MTKDTDQEIGHGKVCTKCGEWKLLGEYHNRAESKDGKRNDCKECVTRRVHQHRIDSPERVRAADKKSKTKHADKKRLRDKKYREENIEKLRENQRRWKKANPEKVKASGARYREKHTDELKIKGTEYRKRPEVVDAQREWQRADRIANPEKYKENSRRQREKNREKINARNLAAMKEKYASDPEYRDRKRADSKVRGKVWRSENADKTRVHVLIRRGRKRNADGSHTADDIRRINYEQDYKCVYCKTPTHDGYHVDHKTPLARGGSNWPDNLQVLCAHCNVSKWSRTHEEYIEYREKLTPANDNEKSGP